MARIHLKWIECETPREMMNRTGETKFYDFFGREKLRFIIHHRI